MVQKFLAYICLPISLLYLESLKADTSAQVTFLPDGGKAVIKKETSSYDQNCRATREYVQFEKLASKQAQDRINQIILRHMTVGKKLKESDCLGDGTQTEFRNAAVLTGGRKNKVGLSYVVVFPGNSNYRAWCETYSLKDGSKIDVYACLTKAKGLRRSLTETLCSSVRPKDPKDYLQTNAYQSCLSTLNERAVRFCLNNTGLKIDSLGPNRIEFDGPSVELGEKEIGQYFSRKCDL